MIPRQNGKSTLTLEFYKMHAEICELKEKNYALKVKVHLLEKQLEKAEAALIAIESDWSTEETRTKVSEYFGYETIKYQSEKSNGN